MSVDLKATADFSEFTYLLKEHYLTKYSYETDCSDNCFICSGNKMFVVVCTWVDPPYVIMQSPLKHNTQSSYIQLQIKETVLGLAF